MAERRVGPGTGSPNRANRMTTLETCRDGLPGHPIELVGVVTWHGNYSAFNGYRFTPSDYSHLRCACGSSWRTNAAYVEELPTWRESDG